MEVGGAMSGMRRGLMLLAVLVAMMAGWVNVAMAQVATTTVQDVVYSANGTPASGTVLVSWNAFTTAGGQSVASGSTSVTLGAGGTLSLALAPNAGSTPMGSYYTAVFHLSDGTTSREYWVVPVTVPGGATTVTLATIKSDVMPVSVAMQTVSKTYVDDAIAAAASGFPLATSPYVLTAGSTMTGPLGLPADPVNPNQAANKNYVDENVAAVAAGVGQKVSLLPSASQTITQPSGTSLSISGSSASETFTGMGVASQANITASTAAANPGTGSYQLQQNSLNCYQLGFDVGPSGTSAQGWSYCGLGVDTFMSGTRGIMQRSSSNFSHFGEGDTADEYGYLTAFGGKIAYADEGVTGMTKQVHQMGDFSGPINSGASFGSNLISTSAMNCSGYCMTLDTKQYPDGGIMLDLSRPSATATLGSEGNTSFVPSGSTSTYYNLTSGTVAPSSAWGQIISSSCTGNGNGQGQTYTLTTCNVTLGTSPASPGAFVVGKDVFLTGPFEEEAAVTAVGAVSSGVQSVTFSTRYAWNNYNPIIMQGGPGGQSFTTGANQPAYFVLGATSSTQIFFANCVIGQCNAGAGILPGATSNVTFYPSAFIIGDNGGASGYANLATNTVNWTTGDTAEGAPTSEFSGDVLRLVYGQTTPVDGGQAPTLISLQDDGPSNVVSAISINQNQGNGYGNGGNVMSAGGSYGNDFYFGYRPANGGAIMYVQGNEPNGEATTPYYIWEDASSFGKLIYNPGANVLTSTAQLVAPNPLTFTFSTPGESVGGRLGIQGGLGQPSGACPAGTPLLQTNYTAYGQNANISYCDGVNSWLPLLQMNSTNTQVTIPNLATLPVSQGGTGTTTPSLVAGANVSITGTWPNQTIAVAAATELAAPAAAWPSWLTPTVSATGNTPSLAVSASAIPNTALAHASMTVNGQNCSLGSTCTITASPAAEVKYYAAAVCDSGAAFASGMTRYDNQAPQVGCVSPSSSGLGYLAFSATPAVPQYAEATVSTPPYWTGTSIAINFYAAATAGNVTWEVQTACVSANAVVGAPNFGAAVPVTASVSSTSDGDVVTAVLANIGSPGANGCPSTSTVPGLLTYRIYRSASDTAAGNANLLGATLITGRSQ